MNCIDVFWPYDGSIDDLEVFRLRLEVDLGTVLGTCDELDAFVSIPDEGDMAFLQKKVKSGAAIEKLVLLQVNGMIDWPKVLETRLTYLSRGENTILVSVGKNKSIGQRTAKQK
ncbi:hypothetical protein Tco_0075917, partial [Tanacetum coccineum]